MKTKQLINDYLGVIFLFFIMILALIYVGVTIYDVFHPGPNKTITFNVTGITNSTNATTLTQLHFECIKYCTNYYGSSGYTKDCYDQCALLGKEK